MVAVIANRFVRGLSVLIRRSEQVEASALAAGWQGKKAGDGEIFPLGTRFRVSNKGNWHRPSRHGRREAGQYGMSLTRRSEATWRPVVLLRGLGGIA
jgi:hypothetical protein